VLKVPRRAHDAQLVVNEVVACRLAAALRARGCAVPTPVVLRASTSGELPFVLQTCIPGSRMCDLWMKGALAPRQQARLLRQLGRILCTLHRGARGCVSGFGSIVDVKGKVKDRVEGDSGSGGGSGHGEGGGHATRVCGQSSGFSDLLGKGYARLTGPGDATVGGGATTSTFPTSLGPALAVVGQALGRAMFQLKLVTPAQRDDVILFVAVVVDL